MDGQQRQNLVQLVRSNIEKVRRFKDRGLGEQNTKASLIEPVLSLLGWDILDPDEVHREFKSKSKDKPVDYALKLMRTPKLFLEAKGLGEDISNRKWVAQVLSYAVVAGVEWCVLSDGDTYRFFNAAAPVDAEEKLFRKIRLSTDSEDEIVDSLSLISRENLQENALVVLWDIHFADRRVKAALRALLDGPDKGLVRLLRRKIPALKPKDILASLNRLDVHVGALSLPPQQLPQRRTKKPLIKAHGVSLTDLVTAGLLKPSEKIWTRYKDEELEGMITSDGQVEFRGRRYGNPSAAGAEAKKVVTGEAKATNGWVFWSIRDQQGECRTLAELRSRFLAISKGK